MHSGKIAAGVLAQALEKGDVSKEALLPYNKQFGDAMNPYYKLMSDTRDYIACDAETFNEFVRWTKAHPDYPNLQPRTLWPTYIKEVLKK